MRVKKKTEFEDGAIREGFIKVNFACADLWICSMLKSNLK